MDVRKTKLQRQKEHMDALNQMKTRQFFHCLDVWKRFFQVEPVWFHPQTGLSFKKARYASVRESVGKKQYRRKQVT